jgi:N-acyl-D-aspartate/D-glutamate deacylase
MESGVYPAAPWYARREDQSPVHFGASAGYQAARIKLKHGVEIGHRPTNLQTHPELVGGVQAWSHEPASDEEVSRLTQLIEQALNEGALGIGVGLEYVPAASRTEIFRVFQLAARHGACVFVHVRSSGMMEPASGVAAMQEVIADAAATGAALHIVHVTSSALGSTTVVLEMIADARARGVDVTTEAYPYTAASTLLSSAYFADGWQERLGISYGDLQWSATGERLTQETFSKYRKVPGWVIAHSIPAPVVDAAIKDPALIVASDGIPFDTGGEHPRGAGTFSRVLGYYVRERGLLSLMDAVRKMTLLPAQRLERFVPQMRQKGRLRVGSDADITVFDAATISDRATFEKPMQTSGGIVHVLVSGSFVVKDNKYIDGVFPGRAIRRSPKAAG